MVKIEKGTYYIGINDKIGPIYDLEMPKTKVEISPFYIDETPVTNKDFLEFVKETNYVTEAEKRGFSYVFVYFLDEEQKNMSEKVSDFWYKVQGANFKRPQAKDINIQEILDHPVVHVTRNDAMAYAKWCGKRLPTEAEWEVAAKGGLDTATFYFGDKIDPRYANTWQGNFPVENTKEDGYAATAPVKHYPPNGYGLYSMIGNTWEWCLNLQKVPLNYFNIFSAQEIYSKYSEYSNKRFAMKGGSFLCHHTYCERYRISARTGNFGDMSTNHIGFRCVKDVK